ncbi:MAG TPA: DddA-like double-stranded DNA deaminase toxin [Pseudonocardiaceae bacterium]|nr:DddA-like double-stranded DNA deaminase toxin [Pseudonocardiaceae bacterium]
MSDVLIVGTPFTRTTGLFYDPDGHEIRFTSGEDGDADRVNEILRQVGAAFPGHGAPHPASSHVETKVASRMRDWGVSYGVLVINNPGGVCAGIFGCEQVLDAILPPGATIVVWSPPAIQDEEPDQFTGRSGS